MTVAGALALAAPLLIIACARPSAPVVPSPEAGSARAELTMPADHDRALQQIVPGLGLTDVATMDVVPYLRNSQSVYEPISAATGLPTTLADPAVLKLSRARGTFDVTRPMVFGNLRPGAFYRFEVRAYRDDGALISDAASSSITLQTGHDDRPVLAQLKLALVGIPFSATSSITLVEAEDSQPYDHVRFAFGRLDGETFTPVATRSFARFRGILTLANLAPHTRYRAQATAYATPLAGTPVAEATCDIMVMNDDQAATASITLRVP